MLREIMDVQTGEIASLPEAMLCLHACHVYADGQPFAVILHDCFCQSPMNHMLIHGSVTIV